ncbi:hypothetical protein Cni_G17338 [Canna indica]|uniref:Hexosyltransferase n=1 Tax=Canna indica TaxID=4628 RepID=A0AAQ3KJ32_9LILI|nr:hypothetical protein Cni_G17338 [Canna indica]
MDKFSIFPASPTLSLRKAFILLPICLIALIFFVLYPSSDLRPQSLLTAGCSEPPPTGEIPLSPPDSDLRVLLGVVTVPDTFERRSIIRHAYRLQQPGLANARIDVRFVLCNLTTEEQRVLVAMEIMLYDDVIILDCAENVNDGKTYTYLSTLPRILPGGGGTTRPPYDYVVKTDDDTFYLLGKLSQTARGWPREDLYAGLHVPCRRTEGGFMSGMGYVLSWDLVEWISVSELARRKMMGAEDIMVGKWLNEGGRGRNRFDMNPRMYDYPKGSDNCFRHEFIPDTIAVHKLKDNLKWAKTLQYFNLTRSLNPAAKHYHID